MRSQLVLLAGPNGAGKSTFYELYLRDASLPFLNADVVAAQAGIDSLAAARLLDALRDRMIEERRGFVSETVFSDVEGSKLAMLRRAVDAGYDVTLIYIGLDSPELSAARVAQRTRRGGHDVPRDKLAPRFARSLDNLAAALAVIPTIKIYDNSASDDPYRLVAVFREGVLVERAPGTAPRWLKPVLAPLTPRRPRRPR